MPEPREVSVVITHYKAPDELEACLTALRVQDPSLSLDVVVADSEAQPGVGALVERTYPGARYLAFEDNVGYAKLVNAGLAATDSEYVLVLNADVEIEQGAIVSLAAFLDENPAVGIVGPELTYKSGDHQTTAFGFYRPFTVLCRRTPIGRTALGRRELARFEMKDEVESSLRERSPLDVDWLMGAAMLVRRTAIADMGPIEERYFLYFEDVDWCLRAWQTGWRVVYLPSVRAVHGWARASKKGGLAALFTNPLTRRHVVSSITFFRLHGISVTRAA
ncbi:glycosyltransferase family 2 protein [Amnibacterium flavum]|uniref:Glycosyltransferase 2-like domain-containing protein n=1 Tax=Amnibacterium flavum TaxID=2173173 RepID=A0A2V1HZ44_9MICO|nr:glycosyltransferase family 2 protein [Amnibacterium flavum]PVZ95904.1 hypothetical protein DDQ50_05410 [Amnibacterium flavum]